MSRDRLGEQLIEEGHELLEAIGSLTAAPWLPAGGDGVEATAACSDPQREAAGGDVVERHQLPGEGDRVAEVGRRDEGAEPDSRRHRGGRRQSGYRPEPGRVPE